MRFFRSYEIRARLQTWTVLYGLIALAVTGACYDYQKGTWNRSGEFEWRNGSRTVVVKHLGSISFSDNEDDVVNVSQDGRLLVEVSDLLGTKGLEFTRHLDGSVRRKFFVNGTDTPMNGEAKAWMARMLPEVLRITGINASERAQRILDRQGFEALLSELRLLPNSMVWARYLQEATKSDDLTNEEKLRLVQEVTTADVPDFHKSAVLSKWAPKYSEAGLLESLLEAGETIGSDILQAKVLSTIARQSGVGKSGLLRVIESAERLDHDPIKADILKQVAEIAGGDGDVLMRLRQAADTIESCPIFRTVLSGLDQHGYLSLSEATSGNLSSLQDDLKNEVQ